MSFQSFGFLFVYLPAVLLIYWLLRKKGKRSASVVALIIASLLFAALMSLTGFVVFLLSLGFHYGLALLLLYKGEKKKLILALGVCTDILLLVLFKYGTFLTFSAPGISFYLFCELAFLIECYRGTVKELSVREYLFLTSFFPKLWQGPILRPCDLEEQKEGKDGLTPEEIYRIAFLFTLGLFKKVILADVLGSAADYGYGNPGALHTGEALIVMLSYTLQLYFDFSGYCDMAMALALSFGFELPLNFRSPYASADIMEFWKGWHITLTTFFTRYVYIPLGGSRKGKVRTCLNILIVFFLSGLWHGKGPQFLIWGMMHGVLYLLTRLWRDRKGKGKEGKKTGFAHGCCVVLTFLYVNVAWIFFRAPSISDACAVFRAFGEHWFPRLNAGLVKCFQIPELWYVLKLLTLDRYSFAMYLPMILILGSLTLLVLTGKNAYDLAKKCRICLGNTVLMTVLFIWSVLSFEGVATYLYVNF